MASGSWVLTTGGAWNSNANWNGASFPNATTETASIGTITDITSDQIITLNQAISVGSITFADNNTSGFKWTVATGTGTNTLTFGASTLAAYTDAEISTAIAGTGALTKTQAGTLTFSGGGGHSGTVTISAGTLVYGGSTSFTGSNTLTVNGGTLRTLSTTSTNRSIVVNNGGTAILQAPNATSVTINSGGTASIENTTGTVTANSVNVTITAPTWTTSTRINVANAIGSRGAVTLNVAGAGSTNGQPIIGYPGLTQTDTGYGALYIKSGSFNATGTQSVSTSPYIGYGGGSYGYLEIASGASLTSTNPLNWYVSSSSATNYYYGNSVIVSNGTVNTGAGALYFSGQSRYSSTLFVQSGTLSTNGFTACNDTSSDATAGGQAAVIIGESAGSPAAINAAVNFNIGNTVNSTGYYTVVLRPGGTLSTAAMAAVGAPAPTMAMYVSMRGGTLKTSGAFTVSYPTFHLYEGGTLDATISALKVASPVIAATGNGITPTTFSISAKGAGYIGPPAMKLTRGAGDTTGTGAVAIAKWNSATNQLDAVEVVCPGINYTNNANFVAEGGGYTSVATMPASSTASNSGYAAALTTKGTVTFANANPNTFKDLTISGASAVVNYGDGTLANGASPTANVIFDNTGGKLNFNMVSGTATPVTISGNITGNGQLAHTGGAGIVKLTGNNAVNTTAAISIAAGGALELASTNAAGTDMTYGITVSNGGALRLSGDITPAARPLTLNGTGQTAAVKGALHNVSGSNTYAAAISAVTATTINAEAGTLNLSKTGTTITTSFTGTLACGISGSGAGNIVVAGNIAQSSGVCAFSKAGTGKTTLQGTASTFSGTVSITQGTLEVTALANAASNSSLGTGSDTSAISISDGATLSYIGTGTSTTNRTITAADATTGTITLDASGSGNVTFASVSMGAGGAGVTKTLALSGISAAVNNITSAISNPTTGATAVSKSGTGYWKLSTANTFTGALTQSDAGTLVVSSTNITNTVTVNNGTLKLASGATATNRFGAASTVTIGNGATLNPVSDSNQIGKQAYYNLTLNAGSKIRLGGTA